jgi:hypothetical protein
VDTHEKELLEKLVEREFEGRDELRSQLGSLTAKQLHDDGTLSLHCDSRSPVSATHGLVAEGICKDADGLSISVLLHVGKDGFMHMLEILKYGPSPIINPPAARDLILLKISYERGKIREIVYPEKNGQPD